MKQLKLIYVYDAHCSWCYAFSGVMQQIKEKYKNQFDFEVLSGGMIIGDRIGPIRDAAPPNILEIYESIESYTGVKFGKAYLEKVVKGDSLRNSEIPARALSAFKTHQSNRVIDFAHALQHKLFVEAIEIDDDALYKSLAESFDLDSETFLAQIQTTEVDQAARYDFALSKQLQVTGYPQLLVQTSDTQFYLIAKGYTDFETLNSRIEKVLEELKTA